MERGTKKGGIFNSVPYVFVFEVEEYKVLAFANFVAKEECDGKHILSCCDNYGLDDP